ncbi:LacI family DNA-binding transcriptional regulator [Sphingobium sp. HBC34]|uniref:LacI family DNA-binding transcriptional regulator n=1 Tax=Sphingobium cyanobacteriorum TaxID=3063954 RepID=A0ABT8ZQA8_9SPHN|nr:LacI family DNA-binding transcriptional regulator [Sphingobium sp. HBC34]MDO7836139.1 LacI family DNA-binding transcriptional regulator [Sphingobium sp. HBC34]
MSKAPAEMDVARSGIATAHDVAKVAGVSQSAVSRAFTPGASISERTRKRVLAAAEKLGYRPNQIARSLISGRSRLIGIGVGNLRNPFFSESLEALSVALDRAGYRSLIFPAIERPEVGSSLYDILNYRLDAVVLISTALSQAFSEACALAQVPIITFNRQSTDPNISSVVGENYVGARCLAAHLIAGRHDRYAFIAGGAESSTSQEREAGFADYMAERGLPPPMREESRFTFEGAAAATRRLLMSASPPDAICCVNDYTALAALNVAREEFGMVVGRDISITGYDDVPMAGWPIFALTTYRQSCDDMVDNVVRMIDELKQGQGAASKIVLGGELVVRGSTRTAR